MGVQVRADARWPADVAARLAVLVQRLRCAQADTVTVGRTGVTRADFSFKGFHRGWFVDGRHSYASLERLGDGIAHWDWPRDESDILHHAFSVRVAGWLLFVAADNRTYRRLKRINGV